MLKKILIFISFTILLLITAPESNAIVDPLTSPNNRFGIHIIDEGDLEDAAKLVNSEGGDWGYVTVVIRKDERDTARWQKGFDRMRRLHLIPIVEPPPFKSEKIWENRFEERLIVVFPF